MREHRRPGHPGDAGDGAEPWPSKGRPPWWPAGEPWPPEPGSGSRTWSGLRRRLLRLSLIWLLLVIVVPLGIGVFLAVTVGGWTSVVIAVLSWAGLAVVLGVAVSAGLRSWQPVRSLIDSAGRLADGDYGARAASADRAPLRHVVDSFNRMAERLERSETERRQLLADVGHELRTPLTIIRGELEAIADGVRRPDQAQLRRLLGDVEVMERLLDDLATLSTAEAGMLTIHREPSDVGLLVRQVVDGVGAEATAAGVTVDVATPEGQLEADVDPVRVREIVANLVGNALRATPAGGLVTVTARADGDRVTITVADTGRGIPADEIERVFDRFHKGPGSGGSGLGLTISRNLAEAHGGDITIRSEEGVGTTVTTHLPRGPGPDQPR